LLRIAWRKIETLFQTDEMTRQRVLLNIFPLHEWDKLQELHDKGWNSLNWRSVFRWPSGRNTHEVRDYFGEEVAFFFHWFTFYVRSLSAVAVMSIVTSFRHLVLDEESQGYVQVGVGVVMCCWVALFMNIYKQEESFLIRRWGMSNLTVALEPRKSFRAEKRGTREETAHKLFIWHLSKSYSTKRAFGHVHHPKSKLVRSDILRGLHHD